MLEMHVHVPTVINLLNLRAAGKATALFEGRHHGAPVSFFDVDMDGGGSIALHRHPYVELWIVGEGEAFFTSDGFITLARPDDVVVIPPEVPHSFQNAGTARLRMTCVHASDHVITEWL